METEREDIHKEEQNSKTPWQQTKEGWYDKVPLTIKQLDLIVVLCWIAIGLTVVAIALDAMDIWHLFG